MRRQENPGGPDMHEDVPWLIDHLLAEGSGSLPMNRDLYALAVPVDLARERAQPPGQ